jgi:hypothetical protein
MDSDPDPGADPDPAVFNIGLQEANNKKLNEKNVFLHITF